MWWEMRAVLFDIGVMCGGGPIAVRSRCNVVRSGARAERPGGTVAGYRDREAQQEREGSVAQTAQEWTEAASARATARQEQERVRQQQADVIQQGEAEVAVLNKNLEARSWALQTILETGLARRPELDFDSLKDRTPYPPFVAPPHIAESAPLPSRQTFMPRPITLFGKMFGKQRHARAVARGLQAYQDACIRRDQAERERLKERDRLTAAHERGDREHAERLSHQHAEVDEFE